MDDKIRKYKVAIIVTVCLVLVALIYQYPVFNFEKMYHAKDFAHRIKQDIKMEVVADNKADSVPVQNQEKKLIVPTTVKKPSITPPLPTEPAARPKARPKIVVWAKQYHNIDWTFDNLANGDGGCDISFNRADIDSSDAVVFFMKSANPKDRPKSRRKNQAFVWWSHESPWTVKNYYHHSLTEYDNYFNWTMSFRSDSDVLAAMWPIPTLDYLLLRLGRTEDMNDKNLAEKPRLSEEDFQTQSKTLLTKKTKFISWIASDCSVTQGARNRGTLVNNLEKQGNIKVDRYGKCAKKEIPLLFSKLFETLSPYKFYFAFENSKHCRDYLTEKTAYNSFVGGSVPIIHGPTKEDTAKLLPKGSYIHFEDFPDLKTLGDHLNYLNKNDTAYLEYFSWWKDPGAQTYPRYGFNYGPSFLPRNPKYPQFGPKYVQDDWLEYERFGMYHLCRKLKRGDHLHKTKIIPSLADWWYGTEAKECYT